MVRWNETRKAWEIDVRISLPGGKKKRVRRASPVNTKAGAQQYEKAVLRDLLGAAASGTTPAAPRFDQFARKEFLDTYCPANVSRATLSAADLICERHLIPALGRTALDQITPEQIERYKADKLRTLSVQTVYNHLAFLKWILSLAVQWGRLREVPRIKLPKLPPGRLDFFSPEESQRLLEETARTAPKYYPMILLGLRTGLRLSELRGLQWRAVDLHRRQIRVDSALVLGRLQGTKSGKARTVPLTPDAVAALEALPRGGPWVLGVDEGRRPAGETGVRRAMLRICERAGLPRLSPHGLRHSFASQLVTAGAPLTVVKALMGHSSITTTMKYTHLAPGAEAQAVALLVRGAGGEQGSEAGGRK
jgi:integrase